MEKASNAFARAARLAIFQALALGLLVASLPATAGSAEAKLTVSATILKRTTLKVLAQPSAVVVTANDIARGYVDVPTPAQVAIQSNAPDGYLLDFESEGDFMRQTLVRGLANDVQLSPAGGAIAQRGAGVTRITLALGFRFLLSESARQGTYSWPMRISATPL
jgi:hypothetical protein